MCACAPVHNRECRTTTIAQMAGTPPLQLLLEDLLVGANRCASQADPDPQQLACLARSRMPSAMLCAHDTCFYLSIKLLYFWLL